MNDIAGKLHKELQSVAKPYLDKIQELEAQSENKKGLISSLSKEIESKEKKLEALQSEAGEALKRGEDPRELLSQAAPLTSELDGLKKVLAQAGQPDKQEQDRIQELRQAMSREIHRQIEQTKTFQKQSQAMLDAMRDAAKAKDDWQNGLKKFCAELGIDNRKHWLVDVDDGSEGYELGRKIGAYTAKHAHVFSK